jgi:archaeosine synthase beta-subunit
MPSRACRPRHIKLYNSGSFFDPRAIPPADYPPIAARLALRARHRREPSGAVGENCLRFRDLLAGRWKSPWGSKRFTPAFFRASTSA